MSQDVIAQAIIGKIQTEPLLWDALGGRVYHLHILSGTAKPYLLLTLPDDRIQSYFQIKDDHEIQFQITLTGSLDVGFSALASYQTILMTLLHQQTWRLDSRQTISCWAVANHKPQVNDPLICMSSQWEARLTR